MGTDGVDITKERGKLSLSTTGQQPTKISFVSLNIWYPEKVRKEMVRNHVYCGTCMCFYCPCKNTTTSTRSECDFKIGDKGMHY